MDFSDVLQKPYQVDFENYLCSVCLHLMSGMLTLVQDLHTCSRPLQTFVDISEDKMDIEISARIWPMKSLPLQETTFKEMIPLIL